MLQLQAITEIERRTLTGFWALSYIDGLHERRLIWAAREVAHVPCKVPHTGRTSGQQSSRLVDVCVEDVQLKRVVK